MRYKILLNKKNFSENVKKFPYFKKNKKNDFFIFQKEDFLKDELEDIADKDLIIIYGIGIGYQYLVLKKWLREKKRYLVFIEEDPLIFERFLHSNIAAEILKEERVRIYFKEDAKEVLQEIANKYVFLKFSIQCLPYYRKKRLKRFLRIKKCLEKEFRDNFLQISYYSDFGKAHFKNVFYNLLNAKKIYLASSLKNRFKNIPAIICGAGPSLKEDIGFLKRFQKKALIFAGGTSAEILEKEGVCFDFLSHIDKESILKIKDKEVPFIYQNQMYFKNIWYKTRILARSEELFPLERWINERLGLDQETVEMGWTVGTFVICFAKFLGCDPIVLTGMDFSYRDSKYPFLKKEMQEGIRVKNILQEDVYTQSDWMAAVNFLEGFIKDQKTSFYQTRKEGLYIKGIKYRSLKELQGFFSKEVKIDLKGMKELELKDVSCVLNSLKKSIKKCLEISFDCLENQNFVAGILKLQEEIFFKKHLLFLWSIFGNILKRELGFKKEEEEIHQMIFFQRVCLEFLEDLKKIFG